MFPADTQVLNGPKERSFAQRTAFSAEKPFILQHNKYYVVTAVSGSVSGGDERV